MAPPYSGFGIAADRKHELKWLFPQEKATLHNAFWEHTNSETALSDTMECEQMPAPLQNQLRNAENHFRVITVLSIGNSSEEVQTLPRGRGRRQHTSDDCRRDGKSPHALSDQSYSSSVLSNAELTPISGLFIQATTPGAALTTTRPAFEGKWKLSRSGRRGSAAHSSR